MSSATNKAELKKQIVITGTGRAGTTFLVELLTGLGLDTGFKIEQISGLKNEIAQAGLEHQVGLESSPYIVKDPSFSEYAHTVFANANVDIEHIFIPIRDVELVASSRRKNDKDQWKSLSLNNKINFFRKPWLLQGGLIGTRSRKKGVQESVLMQRLYNLLLESAQYHVPVTFIAFPDLVHRPDFLYSKLAPILQSVSYSDFLSVFEKVANPDLVHDI